MSNLAGELVMRCFHARTTAHILHLKSHSYAQHVALNEFYDGIIPLADSFAEKYQGRYGLIDYPALRYTPEPNGITLMENLADWLSENRYKVCEKTETFLQNIIDEIVEQVYETKYKLTFLK
jgi:hypothetical protein